MKVTTTIKVGRYTYAITPNDRFMDNGRCVQLLTQSKEMTPWGGRPHPVLSKKAVIDLKKFERLEHDHEYRGGVSVFSLVDPEGWAVTVETP